MTTFVEMYHPLIPSTITRPVRVAAQAVDEQAAQGWLLVDPDGVLPDPVTPYYTKEALLSQIQGGAAPIGTALRAAFVPLSADFYDTFTSKGTTALTVADSGQTYTKVGGTGAGLTIISGKLTNTGTASGGLAGYAQVQLSGPVRRIGARFTFGPGADTGAVNLAIWKTSISSWPTIPDSPMHMTVTPVSYGISTWNGGTPTELVPSRFFFAPLTRDGSTIYETEVVIDEQDRIYVFRPDGLVDGPFWSAAVSANMGPYTNHEIYQNNAATETKGAFVAAWADSAVAA